MSPTIKSVETLDELYQFSEIIRKASRPEEVYQAALQIIKKLLGVPKASILLFEADGIMHFKAWLNLSKQYRKAVDGHSPWKKDTKNPQPVLISDVNKEDSLRHLKKIILKEGIQSLGFFPLIVKEKLLGKFMIYYKNPHIFSPEEIELATLIGKHISFAMYRRKTSEDFLNVISDGIIVWDINGKLVFVNNAAATASGYKDAAEMISKPTKWMSNFVLKDEKGEQLKIPDLPGRKVLLNKTSSQKLIQYRNLKTGEVRWVVDKASPIMDENGTLTHVINILHDVTERIELEKRKDEFISTASHELKTPIAALKGYAQILEMQSKDPSTKYFLSKINDQISRLSKLVDNLLDVSKVQSGKLKLQKEKFNIVNLVNETASNFNLISKHEIVVKNGIARKYVYADKYRIDEVLNNLLSNALKFSPKADKVVIKLENKGRKVLVSVKDFGIGISQKNMDRVFEPFFQASSKIRQSFAGLGLGLYISSQIIKQHKGQIWAKSQKGKGTTFYFNLP